MKWSEIRIHTTNEAVEPISNILHEKGAAGLVIEDPLDLEKEHETRFGEVYELDPQEYPDEGVYIKAYLPASEFLRETVTEIKENVRSLRQYGIDIGKSTVTVSEIDEEEWAKAWKKYYKPVKVSDKITIIPTWEEYTPSSSDELILELDPGMAFGTGTHPTTMLSIQALERYLQKDDLVIDVGSGSGVLSIASILLEASKVHAYDLDDVAVKSTTLNAELNNMESRIIAKQNNLLEGVDIKADVIVSNILAEIIEKFIPDAWNNLTEGGYFITSGIIGSKKQYIEEKLKQQGFEIVETNKKEDWISVIARKA